ncbi:MAG: YeeE/YedE thiosulfate transporter family protein, partial [Hyphomicrobiaceae bacterium]
AGTMIGAALLAAGIWLAHRHAVGIWSRAGAFGVGVMIAAAWLATFTIAQHSFDPVAIKSISFTGPSADTLMGLINAPSIPLGFDVGLIPGVFAGSFFASVLAREFKLEGYHGGSSMARYIIGATLMGFGSMLAGGCAVGAAVTGVSVFAITGFIALVAMWVGAAVTDRLLDREPAAAPAATGQSPSHGHGLRSLMTR